ncbi:hypothetical protein [Cyclobacterium sp. SYSU L10401]|uniref:hypothetical protein n=1 Tax=Cyclobacterium sp. SYSU L10401 TaxID=2678657 RepID=UPI0013D3EF41|nr:hypothetical protein [Cyclobacterium sp. SYSU L10401]
MMDKKKVLPVAIVFFLTLFGIYVYMGGLNEVRMELIDCRDIELIGLEYRGTPQDEELGLTFQKVEAERNENPLYTIYYKEPSGKRDTLHVFVGLERGNTGKILSEGWIEKTFECRRAIKASIEMHQLVMPGAGKTKQQMVDFARREQVDPQGVYIDKIISRDKVEVLAPIVD